MQAARIAQVDLTADKRDQIMQTYFELNARPDAVPTLKSLQSAGERLAFLSNMAREMLEANIRHAGLDGLFEHAISTDRACTFKPDP